MDTDELIRELGYDSSPSFLGPDRWNEAVEHAHGLRHTATACAAPAIRGRFRGVYMLGAARGATLRPTTPVVLVCEAPDQASANRIHRLTWNQGSAPFLIVHTPTGVRVYSGFDYDPAPEADGETGRDQSALAIVAFNEVADRLEAFRSQQIDDGRLWQLWGHKVDPSKRVDVRLLAEIRKLRDWLSKSEGLDRSTAHALIGRFIYLRYLHERGVLTDSRIRSWGLDPDDAFGRSVKLRSFHDLLRRVDTWLNGSIFPIPRSGDRAPRAAHVQRVAGVMLGDRVDGQLHLDFLAYDFSHIPIELLSSIYEQFVAAEGRDEESGAYYTPVPLVNFVLGELDDLHPLREGMRVFDPSCGSGAFLVQCYQILVERVRQRLARDLTPSELRQLLVDHIFGLDREEGACRVAEFSLALALLDQMSTETLARSRNFKLPSLHGSNIFCGDFFDDGPWAATASNIDWIVGNPPWVKASPAVETHQPALAWIAEHSATAPVCGKQVAQAFAWKAPGHLRPDGKAMVAFVLPATLLFEKQDAFRKAFLRDMDVAVVANLANLRRDLFQGAEQPAAVLLYSNGSRAAHDHIAVFSPMMLNQAATRPREHGHRQAIWSISVNHDEVTFLSKRDVVSGDALPWKASMWGSHRDLRLLRDLARRFSSLKTFAKNRWHIAEGLQLRNRGDEQEAVDRLDEVVGQPLLLTTPLRDRPHVHSFGSAAVRLVGASEGFVRSGRGVRPLQICQPPHVVVSAARTFAVYCDKFLVVPGRQIGIAGPRKDESLLRALALFLSSSFTRYHQFFLAPQEGIRGGRSTLDVLLELPIPLAEMDTAALAPWVDLQHQLAALSDRRWTLPEEKLLSRADELIELDERSAALERHVDDLVYAALGLHSRERWLVEDLVQVRMDLVDGKVGRRAAASPTDEEVVAYAQVLRDALDSFLDRGDRFRHALTILRHGSAGMVEIKFRDSGEPHPVRIGDVSTRLGHELVRMRERIERHNGQWMYFDRNLTIYLEGNVYLFKPLERVTWTRSQAVRDADGLIADLVRSGAAAS